MDGPAVVETFSIIEAAEAIGRTPLTFRRWIDRDMVPAPYLREEGNRPCVYSRGELEVMAAVLAKHKEDFQYLCEKHEHVRHNMQQHMQAYRSNHI